MINPTGSTTFGQGKIIIHLHMLSVLILTIQPPELTDAIAEDWGGKPFVDMQKGWTYALDKYPEVCRGIMRCPTIS